MCWESLLIGWVERGVLEKIKVRLIRAVRVGDLSYLSLPLQLDEARVLSVR